MTLVEKVQNTHIRNRTFTGIVPDQSRPGPHGTNTRNVDDGATAPCFQGGHGGPDAQKDALDVDGHDLVVFLLRDLQRGFVLVARPGVVDEHVDPAELVNGRLHHLVPVGLDRDVGRDGVYVLVLLRAGRVGLLEAFGVHVGRDYFGAFFDEFLGAC